MVEVNAAGRPRWRYDHKAFFMLTECPCIVMVWERTGMWRWFVSCAYGEGRDSCPSRKGAKRAAALAHKCLCEATP